MSAETSSEHDLATVEGRSAFLADTFDIDAYREICHRAAERDPTDVRAAIQVADALGLIGDYSQRKARLQAIHAAHPDHITSNVALGIVLLEEGRYREGWPHYQHRLRAISAAAPQQGLPDKHRWDGVPKVGQRICLVREQGLGDTLQFARYAINLGRLGVRVALNVQPDLRPLLSQSPALGEILQVGASTELQGWDYMLELVPMFSPTLQDVAWPGAYVSPPSAPRPQRLPASKAGSDVRVGLAWYGSTKNLGDGLRSARLPDFEPLADVPNLGLFALQTVREIDIPGDARAVPWIVDISQHTYPFKALAQSIAAMDVVVSVCTSIAHLAGAMGKPTLIPLSTKPDWRWGTSGDSTPWYPSARLFRQDRLGDWSAPVAGIVEALAEM